MTARKIFIQKTIGCPACEKDVPIKYPNPRLYVAAEREGDEHVVRYRWAEGIQTDVTPHYYFIFQCPFCLFADIRANVENVNKRPESIQLGKLFKRIAPSKKKLLAKLRGKVQAKLDHMSAIMTHLAAFLVVQLAEDKKKINHGNLARISIRLAWLYREMGEEAPHLEPQDHSDPAFESLEDAMETFRGQLTGLTESLSTLRQAAKRWDKNQPSPDDPEAEDSYDAVTALMADKLDEVQQLHTLMLHKSMEEKEARPLQSEPVTGTASELEQFLASIGDDRALLPGNESFCLERAIEAFAYSFQYESNYQSIERSMALMHLMVELCLRLGDSERALDWASQAHRNGVKGRSELQERIRHGKANKKLTAHDERMLTRKIGSLNMAIQQAGEKRLKIVQMLLKKLEEPIKELLAKTEGQPIEARIQALTEADIPESIIAALRDKGLLKEQKKKGWFGLGKG